MHLDQWVAEARRAVAEEGKPAATLQMHEYLSAMTLDIIAGAGASYAFYLEPCMSL
jgi:hypothetical protein